MAARDQAPMAFTADSPVGGFRLAIIALCSLFIEPRQGVAEADPSDATAEEPWIDGRPSLEDVCTESHSGALGEAAAERRDHAPQPDGDDRTAIRTASGGRGEEAAAVRGGGDGIGAEEDRRGPGEPVPLPEAKPQRSGRSGAQCGPGHRCRSP